MLSARLYALRSGSAFMAVLLWQITCCFRACEREAALPRDLTPCHGKSATLRSSPRAGLAPPAVAGALRGPRREGRSILLGSDRVQTHLKHALPLANRTIT